MQRAAAVNPTDEEELFLSLSWFLLGAGFVFDGLFLVAFLCFPDAFSWVEFLLFTPSFDKEALFLSLFLFLLGAESVVSFCGLFGVCEEVLLFSPSCSLSVIGLFSSVGLLLLLLSPIVTVDAITDVVFFGRGKRLLLTVRSSFWLFGIKLLLSLSWFLLRYGFVFDGLFSFACWK